MNINMVNEGKYLHVTTVGDDGDGVVYKHIHLTNGCRRMKRRTK